VGAGGGKNPLGCCWLLGAAVGGGASILWAGQPAPPVLCCLLALGGEFAGQLHLFGGQQKPLKGSKQNGWLGNYALWPPVFTIACPGWARAGHCFFGRLTWTTALLHPGPNSLAGPRQIAVGQRLQERG